jgi:branched-chain amino acid transport system permease protein
MMRLRMYYPVLVSALLIVALHLVLAAAHATYYMTQVTMSAYYALVVIGLCLLMGYAGQASLGHAGFFAIGGYTSAVLTTCNLSAFRDAPAIAALRSIGLVVQWQDLYGKEVLSFSPWLAFGAALLLAGLIALVIGLPVIRLKGHYLAMATLGFGLIVYRIVLGAQLFGRADGVSNVPAFRLVDGLQVNGRALFRVQNYYIAWVVVLAAMVLAINLVHSRVGRALRSIHQSEEAAHSLGVDTYRYKLATFVLSALFAAVGGVLLTHYNGSIGPSEATVMKSVRYVAIVAVGGMANLWGALVMGVLLNFLSLRGVFGTYDDAVFGAILILIMLFAPNGLLRVPNLRAVSSVGRASALAFQRVVRGRTTSTRRSHG